MKLAMLLPYSNRFSEAVDRVVQLEKAERDHGSPKQDAVASTCWREEMLLWQGCHAESAEIAPGIQAQSQRERCMP